MQNEMHKLVEQLNTWAHEYYDLDAPTVDDSVYDAMYDKLVELETSTGVVLAGSPTQKVQGEVLSSFTKVKHTHPMLSADKTTDIREMDKFMGGHNVVGSYKADGCSLILHYSNGNFKQALTRGDGTFGEDVSHTARFITNLPMTIPYKEELELRGECVISWDNYNKMNDGTLGAIRNVVAGALRQLDSNNVKDKCLEFYAFDLVSWRENGIKTKVSSFEFLESLGFSVIAYELLAADEMFETFTKKFDREKYFLPTDGWICCYNDLEYGASLGETSHHPRNMKALKPAVEAVPTKFRGVDYKVNRNGIISLTAMFDEVEIDNTIISRATLHNVDIFEAHKLGIGDTIEIIKCNMIIPGVKQNLTKSGTYKLIDKCPICGTPLEIRKEANTRNLFCPNENCIAKKLAQFNHFVSRECMNIEGLSEASLEQFINAGLIETYADIYKLHKKKKEIMKLEGWGEKSYQNLIEAIDTSRHTTLTRFINAMGIPNIGKSASKSISKTFHGDIDEFLRSGNTYDFTTIDDFGEAMHSAMQKWFFEEHILDAGLLDELEFQKDEIKETIINEYIKDRTFVITGALSKPRKWYEDYIASNNGKLSGSVSKKTFALITNETEETTKYKKAKELGIEIMNEEEFCSKVGISK